MVESGPIPGSVESVRVSKTDPASLGKAYHQCEYRKMVESGPVPGPGRIRACIGKLTRRVPEKLTISVNTEKMVESGPVPGSGRIRASTEKLTRRVPEKLTISVNTDKWLNPRQYRDQVDSVRVPKNRPGESWKSLQSV